MHKCRAKNIQLAVAPHSGQFHRISPARTLPALMTAEHSNVEASTLADAYFRILVQGVRDYAIFFLDPQGVVRS